MGQDGLKTIPGLLEWGVAARPMEGQAASGDAYLVKPLSGRILVAVVDALGHGHEAAEAARVAVSVLERDAEEPVTVLLQRCDVALRPTRGAVVSLAVFDQRAKTMTWIGVGNVEGLLLPADPGARPVRDSLVQRGGVVGSRLPPLLSSVKPIHRGDLLVLATDGIRTDFAMYVVSDAPVQALADRLLARCGKGNDDALVLVARYQGEGA